MAKDTKALEDVTAAIVANRERAPYLSDWQHQKTGFVYRVLHHVIIEATMEPAVTYYRRSAPPEETWCRPAAEFFDGRFERV